VRKSLMIISALLATLLLLSVLLVEHAWSQQHQEVVVANFPEIQRVEGNVSVQGTVRHAKLVRRENQVVPPVAREETKDLIEAGSLDTDGFTSVVLSLQGEVRGTLSRGGPVGAILVPAEREVMDMLNEQGRIHFPLEVTAALGRREVTTFSSQIHLTVGFPRYNVYLYNSTDKSVDVDLYLYLMN